MFLRMLTYISASVCCNRTYCLVGCCVKTLCSHHCEILSFPLELLCVVSKMLAQQQRYYKIFKVLTLQHLQKLKKSQSFNFFDFFLSLMQLTWLYKNNCTYIYFHFPVESIVKDEIVGHSNSVWFHWMTLAIIVIANVS